MTSSWLVLSDTIQGTFRVHMQVLDAAALQALQLHFIYCNFLSTLMVQIMNFSSHCFGLSKNLSAYIDFI